MKLAKIIFAFSFSIFLLFSVLPHAISQDRMLEGRGFSQPLHQHHCDHANGQVCFLIGIHEDANTSIPPPPLAKRPGRDRRVRTTDSQFVVTYYGRAPAGARAAFQHAVDIWASFIQPPVPIRIEVDFTNLGILSIGSTILLGKFSHGATNLWYPAALANKLAGRDRDILNADINVVLNNNPAMNWYFGTNANPPSGQFDFVTVALHEIAHGLGVYSAATVEDSEGYVRKGNPRYPYIYDSFVVNGSGTAITSFEDPSPVLFTQFISDDLFWDGTQGKAANDGSRPKIQATSTWSQGASFVHLDNSTYPAEDPNSLMTPFIRQAEAIHHPGPILLGMLEDMGWTINSPPVFATDTTTRSVAENTAAGTNIGSAVTAEDSDTGDTLTYSLRGTDAASFAIDSTTGQLKTSVPLNYEVKDTYTLTVVVDDGTIEDTIEVTINVTDANDPPRFSTASTTREILEGTSANQNIGAPVLATDEDPNDPALTYSLGGTDAGSFSIESTTGQLKTRSSLNYDTRRTYEITVIATGSENLTGSIRVTINVIGIVSFTDTALAAAVRRALGIASEASILTNALASLMSLTASGDDISDLTGLEYATGLTDLVLSNNEIVDLSALENLVSLETLNLSRNDIVNLQYLEDLTSLTTLNLSANAIVDLSNLSGLSNLVTLNLSNNLITDVSPLAGLSRLTTLNLSGNTGITNPEKLYNLEQDGTRITLPPGIEIPDAVVFTDDNLEMAVKDTLGITNSDPVLETDIDDLMSLTATDKEIVNLTGLEEATGLTTLDLGQNSIVSLSPLSGLTSLTGLDLAGNAIENVSPLRNLTNLETLDLDGNKIENVSSLSGLSSLETLNLRNNDVMDVTPLSTMTHLTHLYLSGNENLTNIKHLVKLTSTTIDIDLPDPVNVPDTNLASALRSALSIPSSDSIFPEDMATLTTFSATNKSIVTLTGLEEATGLTTLDLGQNSIVSLSPLSGLTSLTRLDLDGNKIENVSALSGLSNLERLDLDGNKIENVSSLSSLSSLTRLELRNNKVMDVTPLSGMTHLTHLYLNGNENLTNIKQLLKLTSTTIDIDLPNPVDIPDTNLAAALRSALNIPTNDPIIPSEMATLTTFSESSQSIVTLTGLEEATGLTSLTLSGNEIVDLNPLEDLVDLETLDLSGNKIANLRYLKDLSGLTTLNLSANKIVNLSNLSGLSSLETLNLSNNAITDVSPLEDLSSLTTLDLSGNTGITNPEKLYHLEQGGTTITLPPGIEIPDAVVFTDDNLETAVKSVLRIASNDPVLETDIDDLTSLTATNKEIVTLTGLEEATGLTTLDLGQNSIVSLSPLSGLTSLTRLDLDGNKIENVSALSGLSSLERLDLDGNKIENVSSLSSLSSLTRLELLNNDVMDVTPLSGMTHLTHLYLSGNENLTNIKQLLKLTSTTIDIDLPDPVDIPDTNLAAALRSELNIPTNDPIIPSEMATLTTFSASSQSIVTLTGLEEATGLTSLTLSGNEIVDLSPLEDLVDLETLDLSGNKIANLRYLKDLSGLTTLNLSANKIVNLSNLSGLSSLETLNLSNNSITDVSPLEDLSSLTTLDLSGNTGITNPEKLYHLEQGGTTITLPPGIEIPDAVVFTDDNLETAVKSVLRIASNDPVLETDIDDLTSLTATRKSIVNLTGLEKATGLTSLDLDNNVIVSLSPLSDLTRLTSLDLSYNQIENVSSLQNLTRLTSLNLDNNNKIENVSALSGLSSLRRLELRNNNIMDVTPLSGMTHLTHLYLRGNENLTNIKRLLKLASTTIDITLPDFVDIPDTNLAAALRSALSLPTDDPILPEEMEQLTNLTATNRSISDLTGLEAATDVTDLTLSNNMIEDLEPLGDLAGLTDLNLSNNQIVDLEPLEDLTSLETLDLRNNLITDVAPLAGLESLTLLQLGGNSVANPGALYELQRGGTTITGVDVPTDVIFVDANLEAVVRQALRIAAADPISPDVMATLTQLTAAGKSITSLSGLEDAGLLETLDVGQNAISDLGPLSGLTRLERLDLADNPITNISSLSGLTRLERLDLRNNNVTDTALLSRMTHLRYLYVRGNENLESLKQLVKLKEAGTIVDITLPRPVTFGDDNLKVFLRSALGLQPDDPIFPEDMEVLTTFSAPNAGIVTLTGLETATALTRLVLSDNQITSLSPLSRLAHLTDLNLSTNQISSVSSLSGLTSLTDLNLSGNRISSVSSLSRLTNLTTLNLSMNQIITLTSLSGLSSLTTLNLSDNRVRNVLPLQVLSRLRTLNLSGNVGITNADVLYKLEQGGTTVVLPPGIRLPTNAVVFNNTALEASVRSALRISTGYPIYPEKITDLIRLTATRKGIDDLTGLEQAMRLESLDLGDNAISDLEPLENLTGLTTLDLAGNEIETLRSLSGLSNLTILDLDDNQIEDVSPLRNLSSLTRLELRDNAVMDVTPLKDLTNLNQIYLRGNENLENLEWLGALENLRSDINLPDVVRIPDANLDSAVRTALRSAGNTVSNDLPLSEELLESLEALPASNRNIVDLSGCEYMTSLTSLDLRNNRITDVTPLSKLYSLETLMLAGNPILDTSVLRELERRGTEIDITIYRYPFWDVNQDSDVDEADLYLITATITGESPDVNGDGLVNGEDREAADANRDGLVDTDDLLFVFEKQDRPVRLAPPLLSVQDTDLNWQLLERIDAGQLRVQLAILSAKSDGSLKYQQTIAFLQAILITIQPNQTLLLVNYPNPFNPETWIPYQLARGSNVWIAIYDTKGAVVRRLALGYRSEGYYRIPSRAAYWDGRNEVGERVASGIYFYQLETEGVSLLRKMMIIK